MFSTSTYLEWLKDYFDYKFLQAKKGKNFAFIESQILDLQTCFLAVFKT